MAFLLKNVLVHSVDLLASVGGFHCNRNNPVMLESVHIHYQRRALELVER
jgi:hypothetical protein